MDQDPRSSAQDRPEGEAVVNARHRLELLARTIGTHHPDYASGLNQLALLLIMQGDPGTAEPLLRESLEVRRETLGEEHPDFATNLSSLGGLLWARGALDDAAPLLRRAVEIRAATLGAGHPKTLVSVNSLEQLEQARKTATRPTTAPRDSPAPAVFAVPGGVASPDPLTAELDELSEEFASLGDRLGEVAEQVRAGFVCGDDLVAATSHTRVRFAQFSQRVGAAAIDLGLALPQGGLTSLSQIASVLPVVHQAEADRRQAAEERQTALEFLRRVERLTSPAIPSDPALAACCEQASALRARIEAAGKGRLPEEARPLLDGTHPFSALLRLISADDTVDDASWAAWYDAVESGLGTSLAVAAARGRIVPATF